VQLHALNTCTLIRPISPATHPCGGNWPRLRSRSDDHEAAMIMKQPDATEVLAKISKVPDHVRRFTVSADRAIADFQISLELQDALLAAGIPNTRCRGTRCFDRTDLLNISLHLDIGSRPRKVLRWWARELDSRYAGSISYRVDYLMSCPQLGHAGMCIFGMLEPGSNRIELTTDDQHSSMRHSIGFTLQRNWPPFPHVVREILDEVRHISFMRLPPSLRWDVEFIQRERVGDCGGVARILVAKAAARGVAARVSYGLALTPPFGSKHYWAEFLIDGVWVPVDPVFIAALLEWRLLDNARWNRYSSIGGILARIGEVPQPLGLHNGQSTSVRLQVRQVGKSSQLLGRRREQRTYGLPYGGRRSKDFWCQQVSRQLYPERALKIEDYINDIDRFYAKLSERDSGVQGYAWFHQMATTPYYLIERHRPLLHGTSCSGPPVRASCSGLLPSQPRFGQGSPFATLV
jgi:hypothetical protein